MKAASTKQASIDFAKANEHANFALRQIFSLANESICLMKTRARGILPGVVACLVFVLLAGNSKGRCQDIVSVPSAEEMKRGAKIEVISADKAKAVLTPRSTSSTPPTSATTASASYTDGLELAKARMHRYLKGSAETGFQDHELNVLDSDRYHQYKVSGDLLKTRDFTFDLPQSDKVTLFVATSLRLLPEPEPLSQAIEIDAGLAALQVDNSFSGEGFRTSTLGSGLGNTLILNNTQRAKRVSLKVDLFDGAHKSAFMNSGRFPSSEIDLIVFAYDKDDQATNVQKTRGRTRFSIAKSSGLRFWAGYANYKGVGFNQAEGITESVMTGLATEINIGKHEDETLITCKVDGVLVYVTLHRVGTELVSIDVTVGWMDEDQEHEALTRKICGLIEEKML
jgi:hypothetical protein